MLDLRGLTVALSLLLVDQLWRELEGPVATSSPEPDLATEQQVSLDETVGLEKDG